jgi:hypothetical protein
MRNGLSRKKANRVSGTPFKLVKVSNLFKRFVSHENENRFESSSSPKREYYLSKAQALHDKGGDIDSVVSLLDKSVRPIAIRLICGYPISY